MLFISCSAVPIDTDPQVVAGKVAEGSSPINGDINNPFSANQTFADGAIKIQCTVS
jgi:hypothetical protein